MIMFLDGKFRDTEKLETVVANGTGDNPNNCYSRFSRLLYDPKDMKFFSLDGHYWSGLGSDCLGETDPVDWLNDHPVELLKSEVTRLLEIGIGGE